MHDPVRLYARICGRVQGVSFRYYTLRQARILSVTGWVRNRYDGSVEVVAEGERGPVSELLTWLRAGPPSARVERVEERWEQPTGEFEQFEVRL